MRPSPKPFSTAASPLPSSSSRFPLLCGFLIFNHTTKKKLGISNNPDEIKEGGAMGRRKVSAFRSADQGLGYLQFSTEDIYLMLDNEKRNSRVSFFFCFRGLSTTKGDKKINIST